MANTQQMHNPNARNILHGLVMAAVAARSAESLPASDAPATDGDFVCVGTSFENLDSVVERLQDTAAPSTLTLFAKPDLS